MINLTDIQPDILHLEACNFTDKPIGGQLNFSRHLIKAFKNRLALVGWADTKEEPVGRWYIKNIGGINYRYFAIGRSPCFNSKPLIPARLTTWFQIKKYQSRIISIGLSNIIISEHSILMALKAGRNFNVCYCFPGVEPPLSISRYKAAIYLSAMFDLMFFKSLSVKANCILAAADINAITALKQKWKQFIAHRKIAPFPTRVDTDIFYPGPKKKVRSDINIEFDGIMAVVSGRIHWAKGWPFLLDAFKLFLKRYPNSKLIFLGDGDERETLKTKVEMEGLENNILIAGHLSSSGVANYLRAADIFIMGSLKEGWSTVLVEALACHLPIVTTRFSSAEMIVKQGVNGFVVDRDPKVFAKKMDQALKLEDVSKYSEIAIQQYALKYLKNDLLKIWHFQE